mmetsp:Transcript_63987/g.176872  ORF Transcript_63987/g.176872 Transcript_63987/m.176872 type:complete len:257 (-) Transcript_63987:50-820(-)
MERHRRHCAASSSTRRDDGNSSPRGVGKRPAGCDRRRPPGVGLGRRHRHHQAGPPPRPKRRHHGRRLRRWRGQGRRLQRRRQHHHLERHQRPPPTAGGREPDLRHGRHPGTGPSRHLRQPPRHGLERDLGQALAGAGQLRQPAGLDGLQLRRGRGGMPPLGDGAGTAVGGHLGHVHRQRAARAAGSHLRGAAALAAADLQHRLRRRDAPPRDLKRGAAQRIHSSMPHGGFERRKAAAQRRGTARSHLWMPSAGVSR